MAVNVQQNVNNQETLVEANELIEYLVKANNPWAKFFPFQKTTSTEIKYIVKKPNQKKPTKVTDKSARIDVSYADTVTIKQIIENFYAHGENILESDLEADNGQDLLATMQFEVSDDIDKQIAADDTLAVSTYATIIEIEENTPIGNLKAMLKTQDTAFQIDKLEKAKFFITNDLYDTLVYLADNKGLITDNTIAQQLRLSGTTLFIKGIECQVNQDRYMTVGTGDSEEKMPFVLATPLAMKRYYLMNAKIYKEPVQDGKVPRMILVGGEVFSDSYPYMTNEEKTSRWLYKGKYTNTGRKPLSDILKEADLKGTDNIVPVPTNDDIPVAGQVANAVIKKNPDVTINDFLIDQDSIKVTKKPVDGDPYQNGVATAVANGAGNYEGSVNVEFNFGRLNPFINEAEAVTDEVIEDDQPETEAVTDEVIEDDQPKTEAVTDEVIEDDQPETEAVTEE